jgi:hypothetical protein
MTFNAPDAVVSKIEKLLALATSSNEHEARIAANKAAELLTEYNLTVEQVQAKEKDYIVKECPMALKKCPYDTYLRDILQDFFFVRVFGSQGYLLNMEYKTLNICGTAANVKVASYVYDFLNRKFYECWMTYKVQNLKGNEARASYYNGLYEGLWNQLDKTKGAVESKTGLMVIKDKKLEAWMDEEFNLHNTRRPSYSTGDAHAYGCGKEDGSNLRIARGITSTARNNGRYLK